MQTPQPQGQERIQVVAQTDTGRVRKLNEDYVAFRVPSERDQLVAKGVLCIVADGMGGHAAGEVASQMAVGVVLRAYYDDPTPDARASLKTSVETANAAVHEQAEHPSSRPRMGTTVVAAVMRGNVLHVANVGDSRAYLIHGGQIEQITDDHSWVQEQVRAGALTEEQARAHPRRNVVTRALGLHPEVEVDIFDRRMEAGDVLLLCSDGLWEQVADEEIERTVLDHPPEEAARLLIDAANRRGGPDNISLIILRMPGPSPAPAEVPQPAQIAAPPRRVASPSTIALAAVALILIGVAGVLLMGRGGAPPASTIPPTTDAPARPTASPADILPGAEGSPTSNSPALAATATLRPTFTAAPAARALTPSITLTSTAPPPATAMPASTTPPAPTTESAITPPQPVPTSPIVPASVTPAPTATITKKAPAPPGGGDTPPPRPTQGSPVPPIPTIGSPPPISTP